MSDHYTYRITWSAEDGEHVGLCAELPSLSWLGRYPGRSPVGHPAPRGRVRGLTCGPMASRSQEPMADRAYSGKFMVRVPPETHRALAIRAAEQGVSMNRLVSARLARDG